MKLKIATYNIWGGKNYADHIAGKPLGEIPRDANVAAQTVTLLGADIVSFNEICCKTEAQNQVQVIADACGYPYYRFARAIETPKYGAYGNAIVSKYPIIDFKTALIPAEAGIPRAEQRCVFCATVDLGEKCLDVIGTHFGLLDGEKERAIDALFDFVAGSKNECVFMGDLNISMDTPYFARISEKLRLANEGRDELATWPVEMSPERDYTHDSPHLNRQIDHIFVSDGIQVGEVNTLYSVASDHLPIYAEIEI